MYGNQTLIHSTIDHHYYYFCCNSTFIYKPADGRTVCRFVRPAVHLYVHLLAVNIISTVGMQVTYVCIKLINRQTDIVPADTKTTTIFSMTIAA